ncbi:MAG: carboxymuconolactone decarboxylase family protein [Actinobacteria bacterium]|nr:carboxymuconolactone decarboxylase family protein [Actinomycetota bacterium]
MSETEPVRAPDALRPLFDRHPEVQTLLRAARVGLQQDSGLEPREVELVMLAALTALQAPADSFTAHVDRARRLGLTETQIWGVLETLAVVVGIPSLIHAVPRVADALEAGHGA